MLAENVLDESPKLRLKLSKQFVRVYGVILRANVQRQEVNKVLGKGLIVLNPRCDSKGRLRTIVQKIPGEDNQAFLVPIGGLRPHFSVLNFRSRAARFFDPCLSG